MTRRLEFYFFIGSTYSHLSVHRAGALAAEHGVELVWRPWRADPPSCTKAASSSGVRAGWKRRSSGPAGRCEPVVTGDPPAASADFPGCPQCNFTRGSVPRVSSREAEPSAVFQ
jgi:hypothetical protein